jgi:carnitine O-palmitoyltransferase 1
MPWRPSSCQVSALSHQAVAFQFIVSPEGINFHVDNHALEAVFMSGVRSWRNWLIWLKNRIMSGVYPATPASWLFVFFIIMAIQFTDMTYSTQIKTLVNTYFSETFVAPLDFYFGNLVFASVLWLTIVFVSRCILTLLLSYKGFLFEAPGRVSPFTKVWAICLQVWAGSNTTLYCIQYALPKLPLPPLKQTLKKHLASMKPICADQDRYDQWKRLSKEFEEGLGRKLHFYLYLKSWWASNWVTDWWEDYVYLSSRSPIGCNSNYYGTDHLLLPMKATQAARAANMVHALFRYRRMVEHETLAPMFVRGVRPLCSAQYERCFNTTRIPQAGKDRLRHINNVSHIVVNCRGKWYKVNCYYMGDHLKPCDLEKVFQSIIDDSSEPTESELHLPSVTNVNRDSWAWARTEFFKSGPNKESLRAIEDSAFALVLTDTLFDIDLDSDPRSADEYIKQALHGNGHTYWFDKSFSVVVHTNGRINTNTEHSWADAPICSQMFEYALYHELRTQGYTLDGHTNGRSTAKLPTPQRLQWEFSPPCSTYIEECFAENKTLVADIDLRLLYFNQFGKGLMKKIKCSPDGFIQLALQLAYYRDIGSFHLTYEASMTRLYREGRTETVRSCTDGTCDFVKAITAEPRVASKTDLQTLLYTAIKTHQSLYRDCMTGNGVDRHLFCLYVLAKYMKEKSAFLEEVVQESWRLSTSQTPNQQITDLSVDWRELHCGGGFNTVDKNGYGVSYNISGEDLLIFHVSSLFSSQTTDSDRFRDNIAAALCDLRDIFN